MNWIPMVWSPCQSKSAFHATGSNYRFIVYRKRHTPEMSPVFNWFVCMPSHRSCRLAPLIQCDYCPLLFHMDCLDPPLTALPAGKWMCPNHVEHLAVSGLVLAQTELNTFLRKSSQFPFQMFVRCPAEPEDPHPVQSLSALRPVPGQDVPARGQVGLPAKSPSAERAQPTHRPPAQQEDHQGRLAASV